MKCGASDFDVYLSIVLFFVAFGLWLWYVLGTYLPVGVYKNEYDPKLDKYFENVMHLALGASALAILQYLFIKGISLV